MNERSSVSDPIDEGPYMQLIFSRTIPFLDAHSLAAGRAREALFRCDSGDFVLYLSDGKTRSANEERVIFLEPREALLWLNEPLGDQGSFWT
jgi:hypothetical protein